MVKIMINDLDVKSYFDSKAKKRSFSELSLNKQSKKPLVDSENEGYDYEDLVQNTLKLNSFKMVDAVFINDDKIYFLCLRVALFNR